ncbi:DUF6261 family protein [Williamwhitmania taraxaci]|uniref:Uncharacterized protein n=1 Tax=Williamwhitmania taraxaci TaxID=1640674 RepID=A0A1G6H5E9_9BACT|nr:DUF6261 family protein [Williamwhitmania taraxaci]SDB89502.1 hypothetical protein SAMN05216323_100737 [Williamwhitmania taraxaci]
MPNLSHLPNSAIGTTGERIEDVVLGTNNQEVIQSSYFTNLQARNKSFDTSFNLMPMNMYTENVVKLDGLRDKAVRGLFSHLKGQANHPDPLISEVGRKALTIARAVGTPSHIVALPHSEESKEIQKILTNLRANLTPAEIVRINLQPWIDAVEGTQNEFETIYGTRSDDKAQKAEIDSATKERGDLEAAIRGFIKYVEAMEITTAAPFWHDLGMRIEERIQEVLRNSRPNSRPKPDEEK